MTVIPLVNTGTTRTDHNSSPFYDYVTDKLYVGDDGGRLRQFTGVFKGVPAEVITAPWPFGLGASVRTTSPVHVFTTSTTYIADAGGFLYSVTDAGVKTTSARVGFSLGIVDSPIVDPSAGTVYVYVSNDVGVGSPNTNHSAVFQFPVGFAGGASGSKVQVGNGSGSLKSFSGDFDNTYYTSASGKAGNLYVCGFDSAGLGQQIPTLWHIPIAITGAMGVAVAGPALTTAAVNGTSCSTVAEVYNPSAAPAKDWIFMNVANNAVTGGVINCGVAAGCIMSFDVTSGIPAATVGHATVTGGASSVIIDNLAGTAGASQVYFTPLGNQTCTSSGGFGGCAIQASQAALN
jgi:hypothetical protein